MKGIIVEISFDEDINVINGVNARRLIIHELDNLAISLYNEEFDLYRMDWKTKHQIIEEIIIPDKIMNKIMSFKKAQDEFLTITEEFQKLLEGAGKTTSQ